MARRKKKRAPADRPAPEGAAAETAPSADSTVERLRAVRDRLLAGDPAGALAAVDDWLSALGAAPDPPAAPAPEPPETPEIPPLQPLDAPGPRFSVLMAAFDRADLIGEAIESVLAQDFADWELVIVDDGSTDATPDVVRTYAEGEPRIRYVRKPQNEGRSPTRNRAVAEARGEFVLWMADDDLLAPDVLSRYDAILRAEPHVDVIYGKLQLFEGDRDLDVYTPNDWTGRERLLLGAKLHGSCVPDGGTATRRALYAKVGVPVYDPEFVRAQDYELWTRLVPHARFRMVDAVVYRYRKHDGGTSWGPFVDLSYDSKIIRRHLARHPLDALFPRLDWTCPAGARRAALVQVGRLMLEYHDPRNAERFLGAAAGADDDPGLLEHRVRGRLMAGDLDGAAARVARFADRWPGEHPVVARLQDQIEATAALRRDGRAALAAGRPSEAERRAVEHHNRFGLGYDVALLRGLAREAGGDRREGLWFYCQAARLNVDDPEPAERAAALAAALAITGPKVDVAAMRGRLCGVSFAPPVDEPAPGEAAIEAIVRAAGAVTGALRSALNQDRPVMRVLLIGAESPVDDPRVVPVADEAEALARAEAPYVAWLTADAAWTPGHIARLAAALDAGATAAWADGFVADPTGETALEPIPGVDADRLLADDLVPLSALMHRREAAPVFEEGPHRDWVFALDLARAGDLVRVGAPTWVRPRPADDPPIEAPDPDRRRALEAVFQRHPAALLFAPAARARQAARLAPFGVDWPVRGRTGVIVLGGDDPAAFARTLDAIERHTAGPHAVVVVADGPSEATRAALIARCEAHTLVTTPRRLGPAKALNLGLARAGGDRVAILRAGVAPPDGWLGRLRWWAAQDEAPGLVLPAPPGAAPAWGERARVERPDDRCLLVTRAALDAIGGADVTLNPALALDDWLLRLRRAGFGWLAADVAVDGGVERWATPDPADAPVFRARWGGLPTGEALPPIPDDAPTGEALRVPYGAEEGFRFDIPPVTVRDEGGDGARRVLLYPPWGDPAALGRLLALLGGLPAGVIPWLRAAPGAGSDALAALRAAGPEPEAPIWIVDAPLAPDREGGLFTAADAVFVDPDWPDATPVIRRAFDCGRPPLRTAAALAAWARRAAEEPAR